MHFVQDDVAHSYFRIYIHEILILLSARHIISFKPIRRSITENYLQYFSRNMTVSFAFLINIFSLAPFIVGVQNDFTLSSILL